MEDNLYKNLARHLDNLPGGFPSTDSGVELRILKRLFTPEDAELALHLTMLPESARVIGRRAGISTQVVSQRLEDMVAKGLIFKSTRSIGSSGETEVQYSAAQFVVGIWEYQVGRLDVGLIQDVDEYFKTMIDFDLWRRAPQLRTVPVSESIPVSNEIMIYEQAEEIVKRKKNFVVAPCICRKERQMVGEGCGKPLEVCLSFGDASSYYIEYGVGRQISQSDALEILHLANRAGLVLQPGNAQNPSFICACCGDCCGVLRNIRRHPKPASIVSTDFVARVDANECNGCGDCEFRCQMGAIQLDDGIAVLNVDRCIGCGLCVTTCTEQAVQLVRKPVTELPEIPRNTMASYLHLLRERNKLDSGDLAMTVVKSKVDRLLATRRG